MTGSQRRQVTSFDVAAMSGCSQATVSRVFTSPHLVSASTRLKVEAAADRLGYVPNAIARSLKSQRTNIIGAVVPAGGEYWQHALTTFSLQLSERGQQLLLFSFNDATDLAKALRSVQQYRLDGLILASATISTDQMPQLIDTDLPVLAFNQPAASGIVPSVSVDNAGGAAGLADHLTEKGCRSVLFIGGLAAASTDQTRHRGAAEALAARNAACAYLEAGAFTYEAGYRISSEIAALDQLPDAVMVSGDELAFGVLDGLAASGIETPRDILLTGFDGLPQASWSGYDLTTLVQPVNHLVERAIDLLLSQDRNNNDSVPDVVVPGALRLGRTTARPIR